MLKRQHIRHKQHRGRWRHQCVVQLRPGLRRMTVRGHPIGRQTAQFEPYDAVGAAFLHELIASSVQ